MDHAKRGMSWISCIPYLIMLLLCLLSGCLQVEKSGVCEVAEAGSIEITQFLGVYGGETFLVFGKARNTGGLPVEQAVLVVDFLDSERRPVATKQILSDGVIPVNGTWDFEVSLDGPPAREVRFYEITALY